MGDAGVARVPAHHLAGWRHSWQMGIDAPNQRGRRLRRPYGVVFRARFRWRFAEKDSQGRRGGGAGVPEKGHTQRIGTALALEHWQSRRSIWCTMRDRAKVDAPSPLFYGSQQLTAAGWPAA